MVQVSDFVLDNQGFSSFRTELNNILAAQNSNNSGTSRPSSATTGTLWLDTTNAGSNSLSLKFFDGSDDITLANIDTSANTVNFIDSSVTAATEVLNDTSPQLGADLDTNSFNIAFDDAHGINDENGNEQIIFQTTSSAVNQLDITNATTGNAPSIQATGGDSNINLKVGPKGTGLIEVMGATNPGSIQLNCESNSHGIKLTSPPHSSGQSYELKFPTGNVTAGKVLKVDSVSGSGTTGIGQLTFGEAGGGTQWQSSIKTADFTAVANQGFWIDTSSSDVVVTLPSSASVGDIIELADYSRSWGTHSVTLADNGLNFQGTGSSVPVYNENGQHVILIYSGSTKGWIPKLDSVVADKTQTIIRFLNLAGGAAGGSNSGGGGGAGGLKQGTATVTSGDIYTITIGAGGSGVSNRNAGGDGSSSSIRGTSGGNIISVTTGGGGGGGWNSPGEIAGRAGGCGGGSGYSPATGGATGGFGTAGEGFDGGSGNTGGGGGTGAAGKNAPDDGGDGLVSGITATATNFGGGGGGAPGDGGSGGGTDGVLPSGNSSAAAANSGSGSGGVDGGGSSGNGGSGVVILRVRTAAYPGTTTGSPTVTTDGEDSIIKFTGSGTYTA